ncbi:hypothetical protein EVAR_28477_1 [Eumeta japonica]|uniref:Uncharacterized protein n=1 Tax=Eumeta variegata TaxID=151549 RepID=A0A4C1WSM0_EUMVA|nr:hypothetical protein EVAR_28477_1 [Eumeta japonica]
MTPVLSKCLETLLHRGSRTRYATSVLFMQPTRLTFRTEFMRELKLFKNFNSLRLIHTLFSNAIRAGFACAVRVCGSKGQRPSVANGGYVGQRYDPIQNREREAARVHERDAAVGGRQHEALGVLEIEEM